LGWLLSLRYVIRPGLTSRTPKIIIIMIIITITILLLLLKEIFILRN